MPFPDDLPAVLLEEGLLSNDLDAVLLVKSDLAMQTNMDVHRIPIFSRGRIVAE